ncbi:hypothetical protein HRR80_003693 [Exophiala dermatitidis]|nr:hypothetical protein HRR73_002199 [Exophiala dermatitidis]KAJ4536785.1 hypothetical protein HRR76_004811 [Exophiala dermatitidis]KAJ4572070.1 hypothetical protein HRR79_003276 [Exophiala dermatitidis]KAJ4604279.1 hypothetical protein HRR84_001358 [Exophiala dermatitidis]KAJ4618896.1 hypothetical protein HRR85_001891 [Exophiala dermatitidis]
MTDPFSVCVGVIGVFGPAKKVCNGLIVLKHAPREIEELRNALLHLTAVLDRVAVMIQTAGRPDNSHELLQLALDEATRVAEPLHACLGEFTSSDESTSLRKRFDRVIWSRKRGSIKDYTVRLVSVKLSLILALEAEQICSTSRIETKLESVAEKCAVMFSQKPQLYPAHADQGHGPHSPLIGTGANSQQTHPLSFSSRSVEFLQRCFGLGQNIEQVMSSERCDCNCHLSSSWGSPTYLVSIFGRIHIARRPSAPCYQSTCRKSCEATWVTTSFFWYTPAWWPTQRMIAVTLFSTPHLNPYIVLSFPQIVASDSMIFHFATTGNVSGVRGCWKPGQLPQTTSSYAIQANNIEACRLLMKARGRPDLQTAASMTALDLAIAKVLAVAAEEETLPGLTELFQIQDGIGNQRFSRLHETVLCSKAESLTQALDQDIVSLDTPDAHGRTPISWAAARGNHDAVRILMDHLADVHLADVSGMTPLHYAATSNSLACLTLLFGHGADLSAKDKDRGWTPLHYAAFNQANPSWVEELLVHGADVNVKTDNLKTALVLAIMKCHHLTARSLIKHGAAINLKGLDGFTPLNSTLISNSSACMQVLIDAGISLNEIAWKGQTVLHLIALYANEEMIDCLMKADFSRLVLDAVDGARKTAQELLKSASRKASALVVRAFARLCDKVLDDIIFANEADSQDFEDALEEL